MTKTLTDSINRFVALWKRGVANHRLAAKLYSRTRDEYNTEANREFKAQEGFSSWRPTQWTLLYFIGKCVDIMDAGVKDGTWDPEKQTGVISTVYLHFNRPTLPLAMRRKNLSIAEQERLFHEGAILADIHGKQRTVSIRYMQIKDLNQLYDNNGHKRSIIDQIKWMQSQQKPNCVILNDGSIDVKHHCILTPPMIAKLLGTPPYPLKATTLFQLAQKVNK